MATPETQTPLDSLRLRSHNKSSQPNSSEFICSGALRSNDVWADDITSAFIDGCTSMIRWHPVSDWKQRSVAVPVGPSPPLARCLVLFELWLVTCHVWKGLRESFIFLFCIFLNTGPLGFTCFLGAKLHKQIIYSMIYIKQSMYCLFKLYVCILIWDLRKNTLVSMGQRLLN